LILCLPFFAFSQIFVLNDNFEKALNDLSYDLGPLDNFVTFANITNANNNIILDSNAETVFVMQPNKTDK